MATCEVCGAEYESQRATSRYCGASCRQKAGRLSVTKPAEVSVTGLSVTGPASAYRKCGPIPGDPDYLGFRPDHLQPAEAQPRSLPAWVPDVIKDCYARLGPDYRAVIHRLVDSDIPSLQAQGVLIPVWRYEANPCP